MEDAYFVFNRNVISALDRTAVGEDGEADFSCVGEGNEKTESPGNLTSRFNLQVV